MSYETNPSLKGKQKIVEGCPKKTTENPEAFCLHDMPVHLRSMGRDPPAGIEPVIVFEKLPDDRVCPACGVGKDTFVKEGT